MENSSQEARDLLFDHFHKILKINLNNDSFEIIKIPENERINCPTSMTLTDFVSSFCKSNNVAENDCKSVKAHINSLFLKNYFSKNINSFVMRYRRIINGELKWVFLEVQQAQNYSEENAFAFLFIRNIDEAFVKETELSEKYEYMSNYDSLSGLMNYNSYIQLCDEFSHSKFKSSVGVIFCDLNALKYVNDNQGHEAGNEYIKAFSKILTNIFDKGNSYRISGDEFLVIFAGIEKTDFYNRQALLLSRLNEDKTPVASLGWSWDNCPNSIEMVVKDAEIDMYTAKEKFYKDFPQFKRSALEESARREINAIISYLARSHTVLGVIDLERDTYHFFKRDNEIEKENVYFSTWSEYVNYFTSENVMDDYKNLFSRLADSNNLKKSLMTNDSVSCDFQVKDGRWMHLSYRAIEYIKDVPSKVAFFSEIQDTFRTSRLNEKKKIRQEMNVLGGLQLEYSLICIIDVATHEISVFRNNGLPEDLVNNILNNNYEHAIEFFSKKYCYDEDISYFIEHSKFDYVVKTLDTQDYMRFIFRCKPELHNEKNITTGCFYYYKSNADGNNIIFATKNLSNSI